MVKRILDQSLMSDVTDAYSEDALSGEHDSNSDHM